MCLSVNSRKDSGIRSNSRRSSIQQQVCLHFKWYCFTYLLLSSCFLFLLSSLYFSSLPLSLFFPLFFTFMIFFFLFDFSPYLTFFPRTSSFPYRLPLHPLPFPSLLTLYLSTSHLSPLLLLTPLFLFSSTSFLSLLVIGLISFPGFLSVTCMWRITPMCFKTGKENHPKANAERTEYVTMSWSQHLSIVLNLWIMVL